MSLNPTNMDALDPKVTADNGGEFAAILQPEHQIELANNGPAATAATNSSPYGFAQDQADDLVTTVIAIRAGLIALGLFKDSTSNAD